MTAIPSLPLKSAPDLGTLILTRIAQRERDSLKAAVLRSLHDTSLYGQLIFRGASALHGVYLHERYSEDLDFFAAPELAADACAAFCQAGLSLESRPDAVPVYAHRGAVHERVELGVDVIAAHYPEESFLIPQEAVFRAVTGETAPVRTYSLPALLARKLRYVMRRRYAVDFYDLWIGLEKHPEGAGEMREIVRRRESALTCGGCYRAEAALMNLDSLETTWQAELDALMPRVPAFARVRRDLAHWLLSYEAGEELTR